jgi:phage terminase small subunit
MRAGYSKRTSHVTGHDLLQYPEIAQAIQEKMEKLAQKAEISAEIVLDEIRKLAFSKLTDVLTVVDGKVQIKDFSELHPDVKAAIESVRETKDGCLFVKMHDKKGPLEMLMKYLGLFTEKIQHSGPDGGPIQFILPEQAKPSVVQNVITPATKIKNP